MAGQRPHRRYRIWVELRPRDVQVQQVASALIEGAVGVRAAGEAHGRRTRHGAIAGADGGDEHPLNQGFFEKLRIGQDGSVEKVELTEPFRALLGRRMTAGRDRANTNRRYPITDGDRQGSHNEGLVGLTEALTHPSYQVRRLLSMAEAWEQTTSSLADFQPPKPTFQPKQEPSLEERIGEDEAQKIIDAYLAGTKQHQLAARYGTSVSSIKRLLHSHGVRLWSRR